jgi:membrane associated rhomboid family serine protease
MFPFLSDIPTRRWPVVTIVIVIMNVLSLLWLAKLPGQQQAIVTAKWGFVPARVAQISDPNKVVDVQVGKQLVRWGRQIFQVPQVVELPAQPQQILLSALTCMFLHGGWMHLIGNMWFLIVFGNNIEDRLGHFLFAAFYLVGGLAATAAHWAMDTSSTMPIVGASGAIAAVLGGYAVTYPHAKIKSLVFLFMFVTVIDLPALAYLVFWFGIQLFSGLGTLGGGQVDGGVAWWAHVGGFIVGAVMMPLFSRLAPPPPEQQAEVLDADEEWNRQHGFGSQMPKDPNQPRWPQGWQ